MKISSVIHSRTLVIIALMNSTETFSDNMGHKAKSTLNSPLQLIKVNNYDINYTPFLISDFSSRVEVQSRTEDGNLKSQRAIWGSLWAPMELMRALHRVGVKISLLSAIFSIYSPQNRESRRIFFYPTSGIKPGASAFVPNPEISPWWYIYIE